MHVIPLADNCTQLTASAAEIRTTKHDDKISENNISYTYIYLHTHIFCCAKSVHGSLTKESQLSSGNNSLSVGSANLWFIQILLTNSSILVAFFPLSGAWYIIPAKNGFTYFLWFTTKSQAISEKMRYDHRSWDDHCLHVAANQMHNLKFLRLVRQTAVIN